MLRYFLAVGIVVITALIVSNVGLSGLGILLVISGCVASYKLYRDGKHLMKRAGDAQRGAKAETDVAQMLQSLESQDWQIEYNLRIRKWGDADIVLYSPRGNWYVVDVKSHGGTKIYKDGRLQKRYGKNIYDIAEGDLIQKLKGQAKEVKRLKDAPWVTGILCFTRGGVNVSGDEAGGVYIVKADALISILLRLDNK